MYSGFSVLAKVGTTEKGRIMLQFHIYAWDKITHILQIFSN